MKPMMSTNIYEFEPEIAVCGLCMERMDPAAYGKVQERCPNTYGACMKELHKNRTAHKLASILRTDRVKRMVFASVDNSPHCVQLHYIRNELEKIMDLNGVQMQNVVSDGGELVEITPECIAQSKKLNPNQ